MPTLKELREEYKTVIGEQEKFIAEHSDGSGGFKAIGQEGQTAFIQRNKRMEELQGLIAPLAEMENIAAKTAEAAAGLRAPVRSFAFGDLTYGDARSGGAVKSFGELFTQSKDYQERLSQGALGGESMKTMGGFGVNITSADLGGSAGDGMKTLFTTGSYAPFVPRQPLVTLSPQRRPVIADLIPTTTLDLAGMRYMRETTFTNNGATVAEGATKPESALSLTEINTPMSKVANSITVTDEELSDVPTVRDYLDNRLTLMMMQTEEYQLLNGSGTAPDLTGFLTTTGIQNTTKTGTAAGDGFSALLLGITKIESTLGFATVSGQVMHPLDWLQLRTKQDTTGRFILGDPNAVVQTSLWGKQVVPTIAISLGTVLQGDFQNYSHLYRKELLNFRVGYVNDQFIKNLLTILCEMRELLAIYRPSAFGTVTSAPASGVSTF